MNPNSIAPDQADDKIGNRKLYSCGTLTYTRAALFMLFAWILWGDFCFVLMESVVPTILPLKLKLLNCPSWLIGVILTTIPGTLNMTICPWVSFKSDRYRSRWGRRIPFIVFTLPFITVSLIALGFSEEIREVLQRHVPLLQAYAPATVTIALILVFMAAFSFFNMFVGSVFWYLFNDVVPRQFIGRFVGLLRIASTLAGMTYSYFVFRYANTHMREIFVGAALLYFICFGLMCWKVKEGEYPPLEGETEKESQGLRAIKTFFSECFTHKFYWLVFLTTGLWAMAGAMGVFQVFFLQEMGLGVENNEIGTLNAISMGAGLPAMYITAIFVDRWHPLRIGVYLSVFGLVAYLMNWVWIFVHLPGNIFFWLSIGGVLSATFYNTLQGAAAFPRDMRLFPTSRFGQFCSAQATFRSLCTIVGGVSAGLFIDIVRSYCQEPNFAYRFLFGWTTFFAGLATAVTVMLYAEWHRLGGDDHFHPPAPWSPKGVEEQLLVPTIGPQSRWLNLSFWLYDALMALSVLGILPLMWWMQQKQTMLAYHWFGLLLLPLSVLAWWWWVYLKRGILQDMERARHHQELRNGIPHHGMMLVVAIKYLLVLSLWVAQVLITVNRNMETAAIVFGLANVITNFMLIGAIQLMCRIERGYSTTIDVKRGLLLPVDRSISECG
jgi:maltose/moltooligosaccharide transporter